jgi:hypothetical protein
VASSSGVGALLLRKAVGSLRNRAFGAFDSLETATECLAGLQGVSAWRVVALEILVEIAVHCGSLERPRSIAQELGV